MVRLPALALATLTFALVSARSWAPVGDADLEETIAEGRQPELSSTFVQHFSHQRPGTATYIQSQIVQAYPRKTVVVTHDPHFDLLRFAAASEGVVTLTETNQIHALKQVVYTPAQHKRDGAGALSEDISYATFDVVFGSQRMEVIVAKWFEGFAPWTQWHLIADHADDAKELIRACSAYLSTIRDSILVYDQGFWQQDHGLWLAVQSASWDDVILDADFKRRLIHDYTSFYASEEIYQKYQVPWKRGLILLGPAGNGKTISLKAIMNDINATVLYVKSFHTYAGDELGIRQIFQRARAEAPCLLVLEDLDSLITDQNRSFFLNEVDGLEDNDGLLLVGTTNHFDRLDPSLSNRPSRFDRKYTFPNPTRDERKAYAVYWQRKLRHQRDIDFPDSLLDEVADGTGNFSFAYLKEAFVSTLLTLAGREKPTEELKNDFRTILLEQIAFLRKQLESGDAEQAMSASWGKSLSTSKQCGIGSSDGVFRSTTRGQSVFQRRTMPRPLMQV